MAKHWTSALAAVAAVPLLVSLLGACAAAGTDSKPTTNSSAQAGKQSYASFEEFQLALSKCMREQGVNMPDPESDGGLKIQNGGDMTAFNEAATKCRDKVGNPPPQEGGEKGKSDEEMLADHLKIAKCLREHGVEVKDPTASAPLEVPENAPEQALTTCAPNGIRGRTGVK
ncbi:hypothetical protein JOF56_008785 [Kibdelosporangium banguiense]|uniref:Secreted protein n=1 Tax=Kibdelosporangium banguiense TaxID=1365924 RepID=A0ABS4TWR4_9PSEU|nr:hypothetical protein [Kibdelosporangium banguiense]MBP2328400.1 hypothetical protein [Kibdelosporangium banguiense]